MEYFLNWQLFGVLVFFAVGCLAWIQTGTPSSRWVFLFRAFFPSWKFFDEVGDYPTLWYRTTLDETVDSEWQAAFPSKNISLSSFLFHPEGNLLWALRSLTHHLTHDLEKTSEDLTSYQLVRRAVENQIRRSDSKNFGSPEVRFQFKITTSSSPKNLASDEELLRSPFYPLSLTPATPEISL